VLYSYGKSMPFVKYFSAGMIDHLSINAAKALSL